MIAFHKNDIIRNAQKSNSGAAIVTPIPSNMCPHVNGLIRVCFGAKALRRPALCQKIALSSHTHSFSLRHTAFASFVTWCIQMEASMASVLFPIAFTSTFLSKRSSSRRKKRIVTMRWHFHVSHEASLISRVKSCVMSVAGGKTYFTFVCTLFICASLAHMCNVCVSLRHTHAIALGILCGRCTHSLWVFAKKLPRRTLAQDRGGAPLLHSPITLPYFLRSKVQSSGRAVALG